MVTIIVCDLAVRIGHHERLTWPACSKRGCELLGAEDCCVSYLKECDSPTVPLYPGVSPGRGVPGLVSRGWLFGPRTAGCGHTVV